MKKISVLLVCVCLMLAVLPVSAESPAFDHSVIPAFTTVDMAGNTVTDELFTQADLTVLNIWGTYCGPCIGEMP